MNSQQREEDLRKSVRNGKPDDLADLLERHREWMHPFALRLEGNEEDAADLLQEVYCKALGSLDTFEGRSSLRTWLYRITVNVFLDQKRKKRPKRPLPEGELVDRKSENPLAVQISRETFARVRKALDGLPPKQRTVLTLRVYEELSYGEIAEVLGISVDAVKMNVVYARRKMAGLLGMAIS